MDTIIILHIAALWFSTGILSAGETAGARPRIGLALSGGGAKGLAHIGVLKVLEEAGIEVDFITGTSMGSIVGGLYAIGYDAASLEKIALETDWEGLLNDDIPRRNLSFEEKGEESKYIGTLHIHDGGIGLPAGLVSGQKISLLLSRLTLQVHHVEYFRALPIPFLCIATDLETGEAVVLDRGFLPDAMRASMSIPSIFTPVEIGGHLLVDGGLVRNFPAMDVRQMGADFVIGVDVGTHLLSKEELNSLFKVMEQTMNFHGAASAEQARGLCDILITPELEKYSATDFSNVDSLLSLGERAARRALPQLRALARSLEKYPGKTKWRPLIKPVSNLYITEIEVEGLHEVSKNQLFGKLQLKVPSRFTPLELEQAIDRAYGTRFFERITYKLKPGLQGTKLVLRVVEQTDDLFRFGFNYNSDLKSAILLNTTFRNVGVEGSKLLFSAKLSENPLVEGSYFFYTSWRPGLGFGIRTIYNNMDVMLYDVYGAIEVKLDYELFVTNFLVETLFSNSFILGLGMEYRFSSYDVVIGPEDWFDENYHLTSFLAYLEMDTFDRSVYPTSGIQLFTQANWVTNILGSESIEDFNSFSNCTIFFTGVLPIHEKVSILSSFNGGYIDSNDIPGDNLYFIGGGGSFIARDVFPFMGLNFLERSGTKAFVSRLGVQYEFLDNKFLILKGDVGNTSFDFDELFKTDNLLSGLGLTIGIMSPIGPLEYTVMWGSDRKDLLSYLNIGYQF
ncbi:MAG: patatin-like phospholipase family protein [Gemmatimonadota bacterium]|nr:patatin-like phospholipase family protein [Gemmatimonadota bacterium]